MTTGYTNIGASFADTSTTQQFTLGAYAVHNGVEYQYIRAGSAIAVGDALYVDVTDATNEPNTLIPTSAVNQPIAAVAPVAIASGSFGWVVIKGRVASAKVAASTAAGAVLGSSATAGTLSTVTISASPTQAEVQRVLGTSVGRGVVALDAESGGLAEVVVLG